jgi:hypothetical protein
VDDEYEFDDSDSESDGSTVKRDSKVKTGDDSLSSDFLGDWSESE